MQQYMAWFNAFDYEKKQKIVIVHR